MEKVNVLNVKTVLKGLISKNVKIALDASGENIEVTGALDQITQEDKTNIVALKEDIISILKTRSKSKNQTFQTIEKIPDSECYPLSNAQLRLWMLSRYEEASVAYNVPLSSHMVNIEDLESFKKAVHSVIDRHEILRTVFKENEDGEIRQWVLSTEETGFYINVIDYRNEENKDELIQAYIADDSYKPFDLEKGPLIRATLLQVSEKEYTFYFNMHHIVSDGWSLEVMISDVIEYYNAYAYGKEASMKPLKIQYRDYASWQLNQIGSEVYESHKNFWASKLEGSIPVIDFPAYRTRPRVKTYNGIILRTYISAEDTSALKQFINENGGGLFSALFTVLKVAIQRYTNESDITLGTLVAGRDHIDLENQIGFYVNTLAIRDTIDPADTFHSLYKKLKKNVLDSFHHQNYPFDYLVKDMKVKNDISRSAFFDVVIAMQNIKEQSHIALEVDTDEIVDKGFNYSKFDLGMTFEESENLISFETIYNPDIYEKEMIVQFIKHCKQLLPLLLKNQENKLSSVDFLSDEERNTFIKEYNKGKLLVKEESVIDLFEQQAKNTPDAIAISCEGKQITFKELDERSNQLARFLIEKYEITTNDVVGIFSDRNEWTLLSILGILKAGAAYLPVNPELPQDRKEYIVQDSNAKLIITEIDYLFEIDFFDGELFAIDVEEDFESLSYETLEREGSLDDLAYIIYTSGSTGMPKGVGVNHKSLANSIAVRNDYHPNVASSLLVFSFSFDGSVGITWNALTTGATLYIINNETLKNPEKVISLLVENEIEMTICVPSFYKFLMDQPSFEHTKLKRVVLAGEAIPKQLVTRHFQKFDGCKLFNEYGPTENTVWASVTEINKDTERITIGKPVKNTQIYILDDNLNLCPTGVKGELHIGGDNLSKGYLNHPELTAEKFIANPFIKGDRIYKTGDEARWLPNGEIEFIGRKDNQVKIRGYRIELGEIEHQIRKKDSIKNAALLVKDSELDDKELVAFIVSEKAEKASEIQQYLSAKLPNYMIPSLFVQVDEIPLTTNGKVNYDVLLASDAKSIDTGVPYVAPETSEEKLLIEILEDLLKKENVSMLDNFYYLGGDSIKSFQIINKLKQKGYSLKIEDILDCPIIKDLSKRVAINTHVIDQSEVVGDVKLTPIQFDLFNSSTIKNYSHNNQSLVLRSEAPLDPESIEKCAQKLVEHHDALRMVFTQTDNGWKQYNNPINNEHTFVTFHDLSQEKESLKMMGELANDIQTSFELDKGPLFKIGHFRLQDGDYLAMIVNHLVIDGVSWRIILEDIASLYTATLENQELELPLKSDSYQKWANTLHDYSQSEALEKELEYWSKMCNQEIKDIPTDRPIEKEAYKLDGTAHFVLDKETTVMLKTEVPSIFNTEINDVLTTAFGLALKNVFDVNKSVIKMETHGREHIVDDIDVGRTVGWFTSLYPFVLDTASESSVENVLKIKKDFRAVPNKGIGFWIAKYLKQAPLKELKPTIEFNYLGDFGDSVGGGEKGVFEYASAYIGENSDAETNSDVLISILGIETMGELTLSVAYPKELFNEDTMNVLSKAYESQLRMLIRDILTSDASEYAEEVPKKEYYPVSHNQRFVIDLPNSAGMLGPFQYHFESEDKLRRTFQEFIDHYPVLAVKYSEIDGTVIQTPIEAKEVNIDVRIVHYSEEEKVKEISKEYIRNPYKTVGGELIRLLVVINENNGQSYLIVGIHHSVTDHESNLTIANSLNNFLSNISFKVNKSTNVDFVIWQQSFLKTSIANESRQYWKNLFSNVKSDISHKMINNEEGNKLMVKEKFYITGDLFSKLNDIRLKINLPVSAIIMAVHKKMFQQIFNLNQGIQVMLTNGRDQEDENFDFANNLGVFNNFLPIPFVMETDVSHQTFMLKGYKDYLKARMFQQIPFNIIEQDLNNNGIDFEYFMTGHYNFRYSNGDDTAYQELKDTHTTSTNGYRDRFDVQCVSSKTFCEIEINYPEHLSKEEEFKTHFLNTLKLFTENP